MEPLTLTELGARVAARWRIVVTGALVGLAAAAAAHVALPVRYEAVAVVRVDAADPEHLDMTAEEAFAQSRRVTTEALDALGDPALTITTLEDAAAATAVGDSRVLRIAYRSASPRAAARGADAVAQAYLAVRAVDATDVSGVVVDPARTPVAPIGPGLPAMLLAGTALGLLATAPVAATRASAARAS